MADKEDRDEIADDGIYMMGPNGPQPVSGGLADILGKVFEMKEGRDKPTVFPPSFEEVMWFLRHQGRQLRVGDIVKLREGIPGKLPPYKFPMAEDECVVVNVFSEHKVVQADESPSAVEDCVLIFKHFCGAKDCPMEGKLLTYVYDSRWFDVVGNVYNGGVPKNTRKPIPD